jgi:alkanesulfonate monooxygenase SsuD/methylene tetrahydromethanopterin reductase-like flavin-dependent oxidoreductase (luciferase family)
VALDFGLLYDLIVAKPWGPTTELDRIQATIDQMVAADRNNFTHVWMVEHHFLPEFSHSSAPDAVLGAAAALTEKVRIGFGVKLMPFRYNHPVRNAEMAATMDLVSNGRVEVGTGRGATHYEYEGFGVDPARSRAEWEEAIQIMVEAWTTESFSWDSATFQMPERSVVPKPIQKPHPPLWMATTGPESHEVAGRLGLGCLSFTVLVPVEELERRVGLYETGFESATPIGKFANHNIGTYVFTHCAEDAETARKEAGEGILTHARRSLENASKLKSWIEGKVPDLQYLNMLAMLDMNDLTFDWLDANDICIVGDPPTCIEKVKRYRDLGITQLITAHDVWGMPNDLQKQSIELFGKYVIPEFR